MKIEFIYDGSVDWWDWYAYGEDGLPIQFGIGFPTRDDAELSFERWNNVRKENDDERVSDVR
jgi:hypothetical protein